MNGKFLLLQKLGRSLSIVIGIVLIWRGIWYVLDIIDERFFQGSHLWTALLGILIGLIVIYVPDRDFKEIEKI